MYSFYRMGEVEPGDIPPYVNLSEESLRARKAHECTCCHKGIAVGELYQRHVYKFDGEFTVDKKCARCVALDWEAGVD